MEVVTPTPVQLPSLDVHIIRKETGSVAPTPIQSPSPAVQLITGQYNLPTLTLFINVNTDTNASIQLSKTVGDTSTVVSKIISTVGQRSHHIVPHFVGFTKGKQICVSISSIAHVDGFENSLTYCKRGEWFKRKIDVL